MKLPFFSIPASLKLFHTLYQNKYPSSAKAVATGTWGNFLTNSFILFPKCSLSKFLFIRTCPLGKDVKHWMQDNDS